MATTLDLYGAQTGNSIRAAIALEEAGLSYTAKLVDLSGGAQRSAGFLALNPAGKVPVLVEQEAEREPFILTQSNAIVLYSAAKAPGRLLPEDDRDRALALERYFFFVTDVIAVSHAAFSLRHLEAREGRGLLQDRALAALETAERYVAESEFMSGETFGAADIAAFTIAQSMESDISWTRLPNLRKWFERIEGRPSVRRGLRTFNQI